MRNKGYEVNEVLDVEHQATASGICQWRACRVEDDTALRIGPPFGGIRELKLGPGRVRRGPGRAGPSASLVPDSGAVLLWELLERRFLGAECDEDLCASGCGRLDAQVFDRVMAAGGDHVRCPVGHEPCGWSSTPDRSHHRPVHPHPCTRWSPSRPRRPRRPWGTFALRTCTTKLNSSNPTIPTTVNHHTMAGISTRSSGSTEIGLQPVCQTGGSPIVWRDFSAHASTARAGGRKSGVNSIARSG
jgi:hypothetical protein